MDKVRLEDIRMGDVFSRVIGGYLYIKTGRDVILNNGEDSPVCYCLDSEKEYAWWNTPPVYLQYKKEEQIMEGVKKVYKALQETPERKLISLRAQSGQGCLDYKEGEITYAPEGSMGIFTDAALEGAQDNGQGNSTPAHTHGGTVVVHEAMPLGGMMSKSGDSSFFEYDRYPAILLGKEVWKEKHREPIRPEPKFKVGDTVVNNMEGLGLEKPKGLEFKVTKVLWGEEGNYRGHQHWHYHTEGLSPFDEDWLELAPEWVDITNECTVRLSSSRPCWVCVSHGGLERVLLGSKGMHRWCCQDGEYSEDDSYKVEQTDEESFPCGGFRVLKKKS